jgi:hypothetical protein
MIEERLQILRMVETGQIDAEEAASLLAALEADEAEIPIEASHEAPVLTGGPEGAWARFWIYPLMAGGIILLVGAVLMGLVYVTGSARSWLICGWLPMILGLLVILLAWWTRRARWLHLRISEGGSRKMTMSFPLPLTLAAWVLKIAQPFLPQLKETGVDDLIIALRDSATRDEPLYIDVEDDENGERVQLYIG